MPNTNKVKNEFKIGILTISDSGYAGDRLIDISGDTISKICSSKGFTEIFRDIVPDEIKEIRNSLTQWADSQNVDAIFTTGGTGISPRDVTPEATKLILDIEIPGITELMRMKTSEITPTAILSRSIAGIRNNCIIINLPGSPKGVQECLDIILPTLGHALEMVQGQKTHKKL